MTENGCDVPGEDKIPLPDVLDDTFRVDFYRGYVQAAQEAVTYDAVPLRGYFAWSLLGARPPPGRPTVPAALWGGLQVVLLHMVARAEPLRHACYMGCRRARASLPAPCRSSLPMLHQRVMHPWALTHARVGSVENVYTQTAGRRRQSAICVYRHDAEAGSAHWQRPARRRQL